ncbi:MAG TPA: hypothetical protein VGZ22_31495 [Isosphaeraceae bacterium]|jgi:hypothetical protein|nr:hypothetical protein [Isosphaeraceae bacterium]
MLATLSAAAGRILDNFHLFNGTKLTVKSIAEAKSIKTTSTLGSMLHSMCGVLPVDLMVTCVFFLGGPVASR